jgi:putative flippase GtrA
MPSDVADFTLAMNNVIARFVIVGLATVGIDFAVYTVCLSLKFAVVLAKTVGFISGTLFAYFANRMFTFKTNGGGRRFFLFCLLYTISLLANVSANYLVLTILSTMPQAIIIAFIFATGISAALNYFGMKMVVFNDNVRARATIK